MLATEGALQLSEKDNAVLQRNDTHSSAVTKAHYEKFNAYAVANQVCVFVASPPLSFRGFPLLLSSCA